MAPSKCPGWELMDSGRLSRSPNPCPHSDYAYVLLLGCFRARSVGAETVSFTMNLHMRAVFFVIHEFVPESGRFRLRSGTRACSAGAHHAACMVVSAGDADLARMVAGLPAGAGGAGPSAIVCGPGMCQWGIGAAADGASAWQQGWAGRFCLQAGDRAVGCNGTQAMCAMKPYFGMAAATIMLANSIRSSACLLITSATIL